jgi:ubiquinone/menaquinone biosynthesis C-methylase UbiE
MDSICFKEPAFDFYERYILLKPVGELFRPRETPYRVLDVGGNTPASWQGFSSVAATLIPDASVAVVDVYPRAELKNYIQAAGHALPFPDNSFDLVCSLDTLEHISGKDRPAFLAELLRVSRDGLYVAFPYDSPSNRWAESILVEYTSGVLHEPVPALIEHSQLGLPDRPLSLGRLRAG